MRSEPPSGRSRPGAGDRGGTVALGYVSRPNGLAGAVVVHSDPSMAGVFTSGLEVELVPRHGPPIRTRVRSAAPVRGGLRVSFESVRDRNASEALVGATVTVERTALGPFGELEFLDTDLIGLEVVGRDGTSLGRLVEVIATGANDVYVATAADGSEVLIPAVGHAVIGVDLEAGRMTVDAAALEYGGPPPRDAGEAAEPPAQEKPPRADESPASPAGAKRP